MSNVCLCKGVSEEKIIEVVKNGALSFEEVGEKQEQELVLAVVLDANVKSKN